MKLKSIIRKARIRFTSPSNRAVLMKKYGINIGKGCEVYDNVSFGSEPYLIKIGDKVRITSGVRFLTHDGGVWVLRNSGVLPNSDSFGMINIGSNVHIGINSIIMPGVTIGNNVVIGVGSIVTKNIPDNSIACGVPAKVIKSISEYYDKQKEICDYTKEMNNEAKRNYLIKKYNINLQLHN